jgi:opacity protein-like surface antigen
MDPLSFSQIGTPLRTCHAWGSMKKRLLETIVILALIGGRAAYAADVSVSPATPAYDWTGFYTGVTAGAAWGRFDPRTLTAVDTYIGAPGANAVDLAGTQTIKTGGFVTGTEGGYDWQVEHLLLGIEVDLQALDLESAASSGAVRYPGKPGLFTVTSYGNSDWLFTARPRIGFITPNHWLLYVTGGLAVTQLQTEFSFVDNTGAEETGSLHTLKPGYAFGGGVEAPITNKLSIKADYLHSAFSNTAGKSTSNNLLPVFPDQVFTYSSGLKADLFRVGLNYHFGSELEPNGVSILPLKAPSMKAAPSIFKDWTFEAGARTWLSTGTYGGPQPLGGALSSPPVLVSRLIYSDLNALSGETFARADHASGFFVKGYLGSGGIYKGALNDEDFPVGNAYSNTLSEASGHIPYAAIDLGYNFLKAPNAEVGAFVGYDYYEEDINTHGCTQITASNGSCPPPPGLPAPLLGLTDYNHFSSPRLGLSSQLMLTDKLRLSADAAYLPWVSFSGLDDHLLRQLLLPEASNKGNGVMLEATLDYYLTPNWSVGAGGRYWAWNMNAGTTTFDSLIPGPNDIQTARFDAERYGAFIQTSYRWGETSPSSSTPAIPTKAPSRPMNWTGWYVGGHLGGGADDGGWSDPFESTVDVRGGLNLAGFGDRTHATGPLGGGQIGADLQIRQWVLGANLDASLADLHGENTCFSGLGGINCQHIVSALGTLTGRAGFAWGRVLAYVKGGGAWNGTTYNLLGNTNGALALGSGSTSQSMWGWTAGIGVEYALTDRWTTFAEYDHVGFPSATVSFPTVSVIGTNKIAVTQSADLFKMGVNYKFDFGPWAAVAAKN